jgi:beta-glucanase (GH16 family)
MGLVLAFLLALNAYGQVAKSSTPSVNSWTLTWSDEFTEANGSAPDPVKWTLETGGHGWGNNELEYYTNRPQNVQIQNGSLVITALQEKYTGPDGVTRDYTSARMNTAGKFSQTYGRFEARIKIPYGQGIWPAFWMLGNNMKEVDWPNCGEIDIMENIGKEPSIVHGTIHGPGYSGDKGIGESFALPVSRLADDYHVYAVEWEPNAIRFYVDDKLYATRIPANLPRDTKWVYDHPFFLILNVAVGGGWPGNPDKTSVFPQAMLVDYVRVYGVRFRKAACECSSVQGDGAALKGYGGCFCTVLHIQLFEHTSRAVSDRCNRRSANSEATVRSR